MAFILLGSIDQIPPGEGRSFVLENVELAVFRTRAGGVFATQAQCPHRGGPLADGLTDGLTVVCPLHDRMFSLKDGTGVGTDCAVTIYSIRTENMLIYVDIAGATTPAAGGQEKISQLV